MRTALSQRKLESHLCPRKRKRRIRCYYCNALDDEVQPLIESLCQYHFGGVRSPESWKLKAPLNLNTNFFGGRQPTQVVLPQSCLLIDFAISFNIPPIKENGKRRENRPVTHDEIQTSLAIR